MREFDFLVIGGGIAGLTFALEVADFGTVAVLFKKDIEESATAGAQGGIAAVSAADDNFELHIADTLRAGAGLCRREIVELVVSEGPARVKELIGRGVAFDREDAEKYHLHREGGHSRRRIFHAADATGLEVQLALIASARAHENITLFPNSFAVNLITAHKLGIDEAAADRVLGAYVYCGPQQIEPFIADKTLVATGGAGKVYLYTSNPDVATGDGIAMCYRAGARVANMEFFQFHPTCLFHPQAKSFLITEAMRGEGAHLKRLDGERFMPKYHQAAELAPRDIVARAIDHELKSGGDEYVLLDISYRPAEFIREHFPTIYKRCLEYSYDITKEALPIVPAAHYCCGGVVSDEYGRTSLTDLYVAGEVAHTGLHGANRLASNSLLEGLVFAYRAARDCTAKLRRERTVVAVPPWDAGSAVPSDEEVVIEQNWDEIRRFMWNYVGIVRSDKRLERALRRCKLIQGEIDEYYWNFTITPDLLELRNLSLVAELVIRSAAARRESRGLHYNIDHPEPQEEFAVDTVLTTQC